MEKIEDIESVAILKSGGITYEQAVELKSKLKEVLGKEVLIINSTYKIEFLEIEKV